LSEASSQTPGSFEERRASALGGQVIGCTFFGSFLYASCQSSAVSFADNEMNIKKLKQYVTLFIANHTRALL